MIQASLHRPGGDGPFPGVVLLHGCAGISDNLRNWAEILVHEQLVVLVVDSFGPRGIKDTCTATSSGSAAAIGWSEGGAVALRAGQETLANYALKAPGFAAIVGFYPPCHDLTDAIKAPVLLLLGGADDWVTPATCVQRAEALKKDRRIEYVVYQNATHAFDWPSHGAGTQFLGYTLRYDSEATRDALVQIRRFFGAVLR